MKTGYLIILILLFRGTNSFQITAQNKLSEDVASGSNYLVANPIPDRSIQFNISDEGEAKPITWGLDLAWLWDVNIRRGVAFMGKERVDVVRSSFMPTEPLSNGELQGEPLANTNLRIEIIGKWLSDSTEVVLNCDHPNVHSYFYGNAENWAALIDVTAKIHLDAGRKVVSVSPFNEPDFGWGQGTIEDFYRIAIELRKNPRFDSIRISGGNTLNCDEALPWYNYLKNILDEGNTHQLAGSFHNYANFYKTVRANGHHAANDELHNVMEAMVGVEYGLQTGIWWGTAELARGEFVKASEGKRLGYAEHRQNWTAASVYRNPEGKVQAFCGTSERQAATTTYSFISKERDVFFDGYGPQREYFLEIPGGTGYQQGQTNAEKVINITWGDDIQPIIDGNYLLVNRNSGKVIEVTGGSTNAGANIQQTDYSGDKHQQWEVKPVDPRIGGDFSYYSLKNIKSGKSADVFNWSLDNGGNIALWNDTKGSNQQWYLEYAEDGWFYIRSRYSALCLDVQNAGMANGASIIQWENNESHSQQWRFIPVDAGVEFGAPTPPANLIATANAESIRLDWTASPENDVEGYTVFRSESAGGPYNTIARNVKPTAFTDNTRTEKGQFFYVVKAVDKSLNSSVFSEEADAATTGAPGLVAHFKFNKNTLDSSINLNHGATPGELSYVAGKVDSHAISLNGEDAFIQLPATVANQQEITVSAWVYCNERSFIQRIFEFRNNDDEYMYLTPRMRFAIKNGGAEQRLNAGDLPVGEWVHVAVTLGAEVARLYQNGALADESADVNVRPVDFRPIMNYIGKGETPNLMFAGNIDDFRIYNYELSGEEIIALYEDVKTSAPVINVNQVKKLNVYPIPAYDLLKYNYSAGNLPNDLNLKLYNIFGRLVLKKELGNRPNGELDVSGIPSGVYMLKITNGQEFGTKKVIVNH